VVLHVSICFDNMRPLSENTRRIENCIWFRFVASFRAQPGPEPAGGEMRDSQHGGRDGRAGDALAALARSVVVRLSERDEGLARPVNASVVTLIARAVLQSFPDDMDQLRLELRRARISDIDLVDLYFPEVARYLGCAWADDTAPFTDVSIGVARMQGMLRDLGRSWTSNAMADHSGATVLVVLPEGEQHSFGAMLLTGQLRRQGISVRLEVGTSKEELFRLAQDRSFDCAMISVACEEGVPRCREAVAALRQGSRGQLWLVVGGSLPERTADLQARTGADMVTSDPLLALQGAFSRQARMNEAIG
jgi:methylmalonyl-CoA mutase cobalamin-binding subunit